MALFSDTHKDIRKALVERDLSMQELFQRFSELVVAGDKRATKIVEDLERDKRSGNIKKSQMQMDNRSRALIYDMIEEDMGVEDDDDDDD